ncbi:ribosomal protein S16 [Puccinia sorghi]|uniref:Ribosomal protein S16 n=1 Tax=Puccinia sorghi TaxID=27349 RepID=A0A0L6UZ90_9BASI|nr:ribosomal protein S16 [Puccinia sorghi]
MVIRIRLSRTGPRNHPLYNLVAIQAPKRRDAKPLEQLGIFTPQPILKVKKLPSLIDLVHNVELARTQNDPAAIQRIKSGIANGGEITFRKEIRWDVNRIRYWIGVGAQPTESALRLLQAGGIINHPTDLKLLRTKTTQRGTKPRIPLRVAIATTRRGPRGILSRFRRRGLLPLGTKVLDNGKLRIPPSVTKTGRAIMLDPQQWTEKLEKGAQVVQSTPHRILPARWTAVPPTPQQTTPPKSKADPAWWKVKRRRRAAALALTDQLPKPVTHSRTFSSSKPVPTMLKPETKV